MTYALEETSHEYPAQRLTLATPARFDTFVEAFEAAVPSLPDEEALTQLTPDWAAFVRGLEWEAPSGFVRTATAWPSELLQHAGSRSRSVVWTIVHHAIAARLHRLEPGTLLSTHLRIAAHTTARPGTVLTLDVPSAALRSFGNNKITQGGAELDRALGDLLEDLGLPRPSALRR